MNNENTKDSIFDFISNLSEILSPLFIKNSFLYSQYYLKNL